MIDIHCHILSGVDDGSYCLSESVEMARVAVESGTTDIIATPHTNAPGIDLNAWDDSFDAALSELNSALEKDRIPLKIHPGSEIYFTPGVLQMLKTGEAMTLNRSRYFLIEFDFYSREQTILDQCEMAASSGLVPVVAHPERYAAVQEDVQTAYRMKRMGCLLQLNSGSLFGAFGRGAQTAANEMLGDTLADFIASDAHSPYMRSPFIADAHEMVSDVYSIDYSDLLFSWNPGLVLADKEIVSY